MSLAWVSPRELWESSFAAFSLGLLPRYPLEGRWVSLVVVIRVNPENVTAVVLLLSLCVILRIIKWEHRVGSDVWQTDVTVHPGTCSLPFTHPSFRLLLRPCFNCWCCISLHENINNKERFGEK
jgi:hypothetical protein